MASSGPAAWPLPPGAASPQQVLGRTRRGAGEAPSTPIPHRGEGPGVAAVFSPTYDPELDPVPTLGSRLGSLNAEITSAFSEVNVRLAALASRVVDGEQAHATLQQEAQATLESIVSQARLEFNRQGEALLELRADAREEAAMERRYMAETRQGLERLHAGAKEELGPLRQTLAALERRVAGCESAIRARQTPPEGTQPKLYGPTSLPYHVKSHTSVLMCPVSCGFITYTSWPPWEAL